MILLSISLNKLTNACNLILVKKCNVCKNFFFACVFVYTCMYDLWLIEIYIYIYITNAVHLKKQKQKCQQ